MVTSMHPRTPTLIPTFGESSTEHPLIVPGQNPENPSRDSPQNWPCATGVQPGMLGPCNRRAQLDSRLRQPGQLHLFVKIRSTVEPGVIMMHRLLLLISAVSIIVETLTLIIFAVMISDVVAASGLVHDVIRTTGTQLVTIVSSAWQKRWASQKTAQVCAKCRGVVQGE